MYQALALILWVIAVVVVATLLAIQLEASAYEFGRRRA